MSDYIAEEHGQANMFATLFFGVLDTRTGSLLYINGGHDPPLICSAGKVRAKLSPTGPALGLMPGLDFGVSRAELGAGELLLLYTDGVIDARSSDGAFFGEERFGKLVAELSNGAVRELLDAIEEAVERHTSGIPAFDDMTLMGVRRGGDSR